MRIFKNKLFHQWVQELKLNDSNLMKAIDELSKGLYEVNLGGNTYKKRISLENRGKRGGTRTIVAFKNHDKAFFIYGFAKNKQSNILPKEEKALKSLAKIYFSYNDNEIEQAIKKGELFEVK